MTNIVKKLYEKISNIKDDVKEKAMKKMASDIMAGKKPPAVNMMKEFVLNNLPETLANDHPHLKGKIIESITFIGKRIHGKFESILKEKIKDCEVSTRKLDEVGTKRLLSLAPSFNTDNLEEFIIQFDFTKRTVSGVAKNIGELSKNFNW